MPPPSATCRCRATPPGWTAGCGERPRAKARFDTQAWARYAGHASIFRQARIGAVLPRDANDAKAALAVSRRYRLHLVPVPHRHSGQQRHRFDNSIKTRDAGIAASPPATKC